MKPLAVSFLCISVFSVLVTSRARHSPIKFQSEKSKADNENLFDFHDEDDEGSAKSKQNVGTNDERSFHVKVKQQKETKTKAGVMKVIKITETEKVDGQNATSTSFEVIRFPNGTEVIKGKPPKGKLCSRNKDCGAEKYCSFGRCQNCTKEGGMCTRSSECCHGDSGICSIGFCRIVDRSGKNGSYCTRDSECNENLCCQKGFFSPGVCRPFGREGDDCDGGSMLLQSCPCMEGLDCDRRERSEFLPLFVRKTCMKKEKEKNKEVKSDAESEYDFFDDE